MHSLFRYRYLGVVADALVTVDAVGVAGSSDRNSMFLFVSANLNIMNFSLRAQTHIHTHTHINTHTHTASHRWTQQASGGGGAQFAVELDTATRDRRFIATHQVKRDSRCLFIVSFV